MSPEFSPSDRAIILVLKPKRQFKIQHVSHSTAALIKNVIFDRNRRLSS